MHVREVLPRDAIPSVDDPTFGPAYGGDLDDRVVVLEGDPPRAYPVAILHHHEVVNDAVAGVAPAGSASDAGEVPVAVTWCPLCGSAVVYERVHDGRTLTFGVSGKLADDDLVLYDRETGSEWKQSLGRAIAGPLEDAELTALPAAVTTHGRFAADYPDGVVLQPPGGESETASDDDTPEPIDYDDHPYREYFESEGFGLAAHRGTGGRSWDRDDLAPKDVVLGVVADGEPLGFPAERVRAAGGVVTATVGDRDVVVFATPSGIHAYADPGYEFEPATEGNVGGVDEGDGGGRREGKREREGTFRADGTVWDGATGRAADGRRLERVPARRLFAFAWQDDHGPDAFYG